MRVSILIRRLPVSGPAGVADTAVPVGRIFLEQLAQVIETTATLSRLDRRVTIAIHDCETRRVVATVFQTPQPFQENWGSVCFAYVSNNSAHNYNIFQTLQGCRRQHSLSSKNCHENSARSPGIAIQ